MKKTRLLEIVREEIAFALREGDAEDKAAQMAALKATDLEIKALQKKKAELMKTGVSETQLNEIEQLAEMASIVQLKTQLEKQGKDAELSAVKAAEKATLDKLKQNPVFSGEGKNARLKGYVSALKKELKAEHDINLQDLLTKVMLDAEKAGDKFKDDIATNTIEKDAAAQVLGTEKGQRGRKASEKPAEEKPTKKETSPKSEPKAKETTLDDEEGPSSKELEKDETAKELGSTPEEKKVKFNQFLSSVNKNKEDKAKIDGILKLAKDKFKFPKSMLDDLKRAAGRGVE